MNFLNIMKQAKEVQQRFSDLQKELKDARLIGTAGAGLVQITINGEGEALQVNIDQSLLNESKNVLQGLIAGAINDGIKKRKEFKKSRSKDLMGGMKLPEEMNFSFAQDDL